MADTSPAMEQHAMAQGSTFVWHELYAPNADAAIDFYVKALGFGTEEMPMGDMGSYKMLTKNGMGVAGVMSCSDPQMQGVPPHWAVYIGVDDVDARLAKCVELGAKVVVEPMDVPGIGRMVLISDPQGAHVWLYKDAS